MFRRQLLLLLVLLLAGCSWDTAAAVGGHRESASENRGEIIEFTGTVLHVPLEGGFYGILSEHDRKYDPVNLPESFRHDGMDIRLKARTLPGAVGFHMWGKRIEILEIRKR